MSDKPYRARPENGPTNDRRGERCILQDCEWVITNRPGRTWYRENYGPDCDRYRHQHPCNTAL